MAGSLVARTGSGPVAGAESGYERDNAYEMTGKAARKQSEIRRGMGCGMERKKTQKKAGR